MARQGDALAQIIRENLTQSAPASARVLDVAAGIGTQSIPLAERGFQMTARDLSSRAIARLAREAASRGLVIDADVADMRAVRKTVCSQFDAVICCDNSLPHLLTDDDILAALSQCAESLVDDGLFLCSVRDYDRIDRTLNSRHDYGERTRADQVFRLWQEWRWTDNTHYDTIFVVEEHTSSGLIRRVETLTQYYAIGIPKLLELMSAAGLTACRRLDDALYQPVLVGRATSSST